MIGTGFDVRVKIQDIVASQLPEFIISDSPLTDDFLKQFYISQEFQGGAVDLASNLDQYLDLKQLADNTAIDIELVEDISEDDTIIKVNTTKGFPNEWGLLKVDDEIITYTGITTNSFTGAIRGFSGITAHESPNDPSHVVFEATTAASHSADASVTNLSILFLQEFYNKLKFTFAPGFEDITTSSDVNAALWIQNVRSFFQSKGSEESFKILFKVLYGEDPTVIDLEQYLIKPSVSEFSRADYSVVIPIQGNPTKLLGKTVKQSNANVFGSVSQIEPFVRNEELYFKILFFVSNEELSDERKSFTVPGRTKAHVDWVDGNQTLTVDTTIGFQDNNEFITIDGTVFKYETRSVNQFWGVTCETEGKTIKTGDIITEHIFLEGTSDDGEEVKLLMQGVLNDVELDVDPEIVTIDETIQVENLGNNILSERVKRNEPSLKEIVANSLIYNTSVRFEVIELSGTTFSINNAYLDKAFINVGDTVDILQAGTNTKYVSNRLVTGVDYDLATITVEDITGVPNNVPLDLRRNQKYGNSGNAAIRYGNNSVLSDVLNLYDATSYDGSLYVATNSLPSYDIESKLAENIITDIKENNLDGYNSIENTYSTVVVPEDLQFGTGERIVYSVGGGAEPICDVGSYVVEVISRKKFRLYASPSFIGSDNFIELTLTKAPGQHFFTLASQSDRTINGQRKYVTIPIERTSSSTINDDLKQIDEDETIAILTNGVEITTPKSLDRLYYGPLTSINVVNGGDFYSVVSPPSVIVDSSSIPGIGRSAQVSVAMTGKLLDILVDPQDFDISEVFGITVTGGNSPGASAEAQVEQRSRVLNFDARDLRFGGGVDPDEDTISFPVAHNLRAGEPLTYNNRGQDSIELDNGALLGNGGLYYPSLVNSVTIQLHESESDAIVGINTVRISQSETAGGFQSFETTLKPQIVGARIINDGGIFSNRELVIFGRDQVSFVENAILIDNHGFSTGETIVYRGIRNPISPLQRNKEYLVISIDENSFRLCDVGPGDNPTFNLDRNDYIIFNNTGGLSASHIFSYPEIKCTIEVSSSSTSNPVVVGTPIIRGSIDEVYLRNPGFYGSTLINFQNSPTVTAQTGEGARLNSFISKGSLAGVQILFPGSNYSESPILRLVDPTESGIGAVLRAVTENGKITDVVIINPGYSYDERSYIEIIDSNAEALFQANIRQLIINEVERSGFESLSGNSYSILSYERIIRENVYSDNGNEHSPIIGWARDGNPIYGPFGYDVFDNSNSSIRAMIPSYSLDSSNIEGRPGQREYPIGYFIDDYVFDNSGDLDIHNGRYCRTPEFPNGVYAYFATVDNSADSNEKPPVFPYFIGNSFRDEAQREDSNLTQDFNLNDKPIYRNTFPYAIGNPFIGSEFIDQSYLTDDQSAIVTVLTEGPVDNITVVGAGQSYAVGDIARFETDEDIVISTISRINGVPVERMEQTTLSYDKVKTSIVRSNPDEVRIYVEGNHEYLDGDVVTISGLSASLTNLAGSPTVGVSSGVMSLYAPFEGSLFPGVFDIFVNSLSDTISVGSSIILRGEDGLADDTVEVLNIFEVNKALRVRRGVGYNFEHPVGTVINFVPNYITLEDSTTKINTKLNERYYFNATQSIAFGNEVGVGVSVVYSIGNIDTVVDLQTQRIYLPNHNFKKNEKVTFHKALSADNIAGNDSGNTFGIPRDQDTFFIERFDRDTIGLKLTRDSQPIRFLNPTNPVLVDNSEYYLESTRAVESASLDRYSITVHTTKPHGIDTPDNVKLNVVTDRVRGDYNKSAVEIYLDSNREVISTDKQTINSVDVAANLINIENHGLVSGDLVQYTASGANIGGLTSGYSYFIIKFDDNNFSLAEVLADTLPNSELPINITSSRSGVIAKVNPKIRAIGNNAVKFDLSDSSLAGCEFKFYFDAALTKVMENNGEDEEFTVEYRKSPGESNASAIVVYSDNNPRTFYYGVSRDGVIINPDRRVNECSSVSYVESLYNISGDIVKINDNQFRLVSTREVERSYYDIGENEDDVNYDLSYITSSENTIGSISNINIVSSGNNFTKLPSFIVVESEFGTGAELQSSGKDIGKIKDIRIKNPGWGYYSDNTLRPSGKIQPKLEFSNSDFVTNITIENGGNGYQSPPIPVLIDSVTRDVVDNGSIELQIRSSTITEVNVVLAPSGMTKNPHELFVVNGDNGILIQEVISLSRESGSVQYELQTPISGFATPPFTVGERVFIEGVVGEDDVPTNLNSPNIGFNFATVTSTTLSNPFKLTVQYPEEYWDTLLDIEPLQDQKSFATIISRKNYPQFSVEQGTALLLEGEALSYINERGDIQDTDLIVAESNESFFKVVGTFDTRVGDIFKGNISGIIISVTDVENRGATFAVKGTSRVIGGWLDNIGFLNDELQALPNNDYYQNLSYSIKSSITFDELIGPVNKLVHPAGLKNFADTKLESNANIGVSGISTDTVTLDIIGLTDVAGTPLRVDRINTFDLGYDDFVANNKSNAIRINAFANHKKLTDYFSLLTNRVLLMDDISTQFINISNSSDIVKFVSMKYFSSPLQRIVAQIRNPFTNGIELIETVVMFPGGGNSTSIQKAVVSSVSDLGYGEISGFTSGNRNELRYTPYEEFAETEDVDIKILSTEFLNQRTPSTKDIGNVRLHSLTFEVQPGQVQRLFTSRNNATGCVLYIQSQSSISPIRDLRYTELYGFTIGGDSFMSEYTMDSENTFEYSDSNKDLIYNSIRLNGNRVAFQVRNNSDKAYQVVIKVTEFSPQQIGSPIYRFKRQSIPEGTERSVNLISTRNQGPASSELKILTLNKGLYQSARIMAQVKGQNIGAIYQVMIANTTTDAYATTYPFITEGADSEGIGLGTFESRMNGNDIDVFFVPNPGLSGDLDIIAYTEAFYIINDNRNYVDLPLNYGAAEENYYLFEYNAAFGNRRNRVRFPLTYDGYPIYEKKFVPEFTLDGLNTSVFKITEHFFSDLEELYYLPGDSVDGAFSPIQIQPVTDYQGNTTSQMPARVFVIKLSLNSFMLAPTFEDAKARNAIVVTGYGQGNEHSLGMLKKLEKSLITINGIVQSPVSTTNLIYNVNEGLDAEEEYITLSGIGTIATGDLLRIDDEIVNIVDVGFARDASGPITNSGNFPLVKVERGAVGTLPDTHATQSSAELLKGSYNIVESDVVFTEAPAGRGNNPVNESNVIDFNATFQGRTFLQKEYDDIKIYDDISRNFDGISNEYEITTNGQQIDEIINGSGILLINDVYQTPTTENNEGNNYFYEYDENTGVNNVVFTGITSANGDRVESEFDVNQNQIPRGGLIVSLGSTPGLGYAPLVGSIIEPIMSGGRITGVDTQERAGTTTNVVYARYDNISGEMLVSLKGDVASPLLPITNASYNNDSGILIVTTSSSLAGFSAGDLIELDDLLFRCDSENPPGNLTFPREDPLFIVDSIIDANTFAVFVGESDIVHTYVSGGTFQKYSPFLFDDEGTNPTWAYLQNLTFSCPSGTQNNGVTVFPDTVDHLPVIRQVDKGHVLIYVGASEIPHTYVSGGTIGAFVKLTEGSGYNETVNILVTEDGHTGTPAVIEGVPGAGGALSFNVINQGTGYTNPQLSAPEPNYANLPVKVVSKRNPQAVDGKNLFVTLTVGPSRDVSIGKSEYFVIDSVSISNQGYGFAEGDVLEVEGLVPAEGLSAPIEPFQLFVDRTFTDNFTAYNFGELNYIDSIKNLQDGKRTRFPLIYKNEPISFEIDPLNEDSAAIDIENVLLIFVNSVLQVPNESYEFDGGTSFQFLLPPRPEDDVDIYYYLGKDGVDTIQNTDISQTIKPGDEVQLRKNNAIDPSKTQNIRTVTEIIESDTMRTNIYTGRGDLDENRPRPLAWDKQKRDIFIFGEPVTKVRDSLESVIKPEAAILSTVASNSTQILLSSMDLFDYEEEVLEDTVAEFNVRLYEANDVRDADLTIVLGTGNNAGRVVSIQINDGGSGYPSNTRIRFNEPVNGTRAIADVSVNGNGTITGFNIRNRGSGYTSAPSYTLTPPTLRYEDVKATNYSGWSAVITGISVPTNSGTTKIIRFTYKTIDPEVISGDLAQGYRISVFDTKVGPGGVRATTRNSNSVAVSIGDNFLDAVYEVRSVTADALGGTVDVRVAGGTDLTGIESTGENLGYFSWGRLSNLVREAPRTTSVNPFEYDSQFTKYPMARRTSGGLRNNGGIAKQP